MFLFRRSEILHFLPLATRNLSNKPRTGIVLLNMGGPQKIEDVHDYLYSIVTNSDMVKIPLFQEQLGRWIVKLRTPLIQRRYKEIGGGSPTYKWSRKQGELLCKQLDQVSPNTAPHKYYIAFRHCQPSTESALLELESDGVTRAVLFSQFPQYSCATSGSGFGAVYKFYKDRGISKNLKLSVIDRWPIHPLLIKTFSDLIRKELKSIPEKKRKETIILFSAHSLPLKRVTGGDSYPSEIGATVELVMQDLNIDNPYKLVWQSRVGIIPWLGPFTDNVLTSYVAEGKKNFILVPIAFVNEHIETLYEMDIGYCRDLAKELNVENIRRVPTPNDHPLFIDALTQIVTEHLTKGLSVNPNFLNLCPHCTNKNCKQYKEWFSKVCKN